MCSSELLFFLQSEIPASKQELSLCQAAAQDVDCSHDLLYFWKKHKAELPMWAKSCSTSAASTTFFSGLANSLFAFRTSKGRMLPYKIIQRPHWCCNNNPHYTCTLCYSLTHFVTFFFIYLMLFSHCFVVHNITMNNRDIFLNDREQIKYLAQAYLLLCNRQVIPCKSWRNPEICVHWSCWLLMFRL